LGLWTYGGDIFRRELVGGIRNQQAGLECKREHQDVSS